MLEKTSVEKLTTNSSQENKGNINKLSSKTKDGK
jgi:hypothetical protein